MTLAPASPGKWPESIAIHSDTTAHGSLDARVSSKTQQLAQGSTSQPQFVAQASNGLSPRFAGTNSKVRFAPHEIEIEYFSKSQDAQAFKATANEQANMLRHSSSPELFAQKSAAPRDLFDVGVDEEDDGGPHEETVDNFELPVWLTTVFALTGIDSFMYKIEVERQKRSSELYRNPFMETEEIVRSMRFELLIGSAIILNCVIIGWEASVEEGKLAGLFSVFEHCFTGFFLLEWILRVTAFGWAWLFEFANFMDTLLVFGTGVLLKWVLEPLQVDIGGLRILTMARSLRLVRLASLVRLKPGFKEMWMLVCGLKTSVRPLLWTLVIAGCVLYVFGIAATEVIGNSPDFENSELVDELFGNFLRSMFTMLQLMTMDSYSDPIVRPLMEVQPWLSFFFVLVIVVGSFVVLNLVTAIIVGNAYEIRDADKDSKVKEVENIKRAELKNLSKLFFEIDVDGSGELSLYEFFGDGTPDGFRGALGNPKVLQMLDTMEMKPEDLKETWDVLDDGDQSLTIKEFTDGIRRMKGEAKAKDIADVLKQFRVTDAKHEELKKQAFQYQTTLIDIEEDTREILEDFKNAVSLFKEMQHRLSHLIDSQDKRDLREANERKGRWKDAEKMEVDEEEEEDSDGEEEEEVLK